MATPVAVVLMGLLRKLEHLRAEAHHLANTDLLTETFNRRRWIELAERELRRAATTGAPVALLLLDVDHFKQVNDAHGHSLGDAVLKAVAEACRDALRPRDSLARWGGEEFVVLLPETPVDHGAGAAERIRAAVTARIVRDLGLQITICVGVAGEPAAATGYDLDRLVHLADRAMYAAKQAGRNQVRVAQPSESPAVPARSALLPFAHCFSQAGRAQPGRVHRGGVGEAAAPLRHGPGQGMAEQVAADMPSAADIAANRWLPDAELRVYAEEYGRTGFQGGLNGYRGSPGDADLQIFAGKTIDVPATFMGERQDWGVYQNPGALERLEKTLTTKYQGTHLVNGAGHWVQQEQADALSTLLVAFLKRNA